MSGVRRMTKVRSFPFRLFGFVLLVVSAFSMPLQAAESDGLPPLPPLTDPASEEQLLGKFVWADLFSNDIAASRAFYQELLGWEWRWVSEPPNPYGIFSLRGYDLAGLAFRDMEGDEPYSRWVHYVSVADVAVAEDLINGMGGRTLMRRSAADRGEFAILASASEVLLGVMRSSSGDPPDTRSVPGEWIWRQLYTWNLDASMSALQQLADYQVTEADGSDEIDRIVSSGGYARAGVKALAADSEAGPSWLGFVMANDVGTLVDKVPGLGGTVYYQAQSGDMAIIADPGGALIGLVTYDYPAEGAQSEQSAQSGKEQLP
jgi:predicted enzyme related to lactoylglutathione lyase